MAGIENFYKFLLKNPEAQEKFNKCSESNQELISSFLGSHHPETNTDKYYNVIIELAQHQNGLSDDRLKNITDGDEIENVLNDIMERERIKEEMERRIAIVDDYIKSSDFDDLKKNYSIIPEKERKETIQKLLLDNNGVIKSNQLRQCIYEKAIKYYNGEKINK